LQPAEVDEETCLFDLPETPEVVLTLDFDREGNEIVTSKERSAKQPTLADFMPQKGKKQDKRPPKAKPQKKAKDPKGPPSPLRRPPPEEVEVTVEHLLDADKAATHSPRSVVTSPWVNTEESTWETAGPATAGWDEPTPGWSNAPGPTQSYRYTSPPRD